MHRLRPELSPLVAQQRGQYVQPLVKPADPRQMAAGKGIPGTGLQLHTVNLEQGERQCFRLLPVDVRACRVRQVAHFIAQRRKLRQ